MHLRPSTRAGDDWKLRAHILPRLGDVRGDKLDTPAIRRFVAEMAADGVSPATILGVRAVLRMVLGTAVEAGAILVNPCTGIEVPRPMRLEMHLLTAEQVAQLADAITDPAVKRAGHGSGPNWKTHLPEYGLLIRLAAYEPWACWRLWLFDSDRWLVGPLGSAERCFELRWGHGATVPNTPTGASVTQHPGPRTRTVTHLPEPQCQA